MAGVAHREEVRECLGWMRAVCEAIVHRHASEICEISGILMSKTSKLDGIIHPTEHPGGILDRFLVAHLATCGTKISYVCTLVIRGDFEPTPGACGVLFKNQRDVFADKPLLLRAGTFRGFELAGQFQKKSNLVG